MAQDQATGTGVPADIAALSFEEALAELQELVKRLERGDNKLEEAIKAYERGAALKRHCEAKLREAAPSWATTGRFLLVGKIVSPGPKWKLVEAFIPDQRYDDHD